MWPLGGSGWGYGACWACCCTVLACLSSNHFYSSSEDFIGVLLFFFVPWSAINLVDYYLVRRGRYDVASFFTRTASTADSSGGRACAT